MSTDTINTDKKTDNATTENSISKIRVANAPCSWGVLEFELEGKAAGYEQVLDEMQRAGYAGTELGDWGFMPTDPHQLKSELDKRNLTMLAAFIPVELARAEAHAAGIEQAVKTAKLLSSVSDKPFIVLSDDNCKNATRLNEAGRIRKEQGLSDKQWNVFLDGANDVAAEVLKQTGVKTVFHHHCAGFVETPEEIERFIAGTDPSLVGICLDTGHYAFGGGDPVTFLRKHIDRIWHVHFKDLNTVVAKHSAENGWNYFESVRNGIFCGLGKGAIPFDQIVTALREHAYSGWIVVEQDVLPGTGSPFDNAVRSRGYLKYIGL